MVDGFALMQKDTAGITTTATRSYTAGGMVFTQTDGRSNTTTSSVFIIIPCAENFPINYLSPPTIASPVQKRKLSLLEGD